MEKLRNIWHKTPRPARRLLVFIVGVLVIIAGVIMLVIPGPGWAAIFLGLAILATEFEQANRIKQYLLKRFKNVLDKVRNRNKR
jgi:uncharacterized protein (TIGR02611 family)